MRNQELFRDEFFGKDNLALLDTVALEQITGGGLKSIFETYFKRHSEPRLPSTAQINH
ncbi:hypothetical protein PND44_10870 [Lacticaseibacillus paracasei]|nr:hypothetical protein [Lacticaseibacillus paracasei]